MATNQGYCVSPISRHLCLRRRLLCLGLWSDIVVLMMGTWCMYVCMYVCELMVFVRVGEGKGKRGVWVCVRTISTSGCWIYRRTGRYIRVDARPFAGLWLRARFVLAWLVMGAGDPTCLFCLFGEFTITTTIVMTMLIRLDHIRSGYGHDSYAVAFDIQHSFQHTMD